MDLSCIISSGDLELYVLGMLPEPEAAQIAQLALIFPEVQEELDRISAALTGMSAEAAQVPAPGVKGRLMARIQELEGAGTTHTEPPVVPLQSGRYINVADEEQQGRPRVVTMPAPKGRVLQRNWVAAASFIGLLLAVGALLFLVDRNRTYRADIAALEQNNQALNRNVVELQRQNRSTNEMVAMLQSDIFKKIQLKAVAGKPDALVQLLWNTRTKEVFVSNISLPRTPQGKQYQLWAIVDGKPVDGGMLQDVRSRVQQMKTFARAEAFAITLERTGGSPVPTMEAMYVMGGA